MPSTLVQLAILISDSVQVIDTRCAATGLEVPSLDAPFHSSSEAFRMDPLVSEAISIISIAAGQLNAILQPPHVSAMQISSGHHQSAALHALLDGNTVEILRDAGRQGLHVNEISVKNGIDSKKQARLLRYLATKLVFREVRPDTFANNRISSVFDTGKSIDHLRLSPKERDVGFNAIINHGFVEGMLASSCLSKNLLDPLTAHSEEPNASPWHRSTGVTVPYWSYIQQSGQEIRLQRFSNVMRGVASMLPPDDILNGFDWTTLHSGDIVVDVGSGVGATSLVLAKAHPQINIILQDEQLTLDEAMRVWNTELQPAIQSGRVRMQAHDFFTDQPVKNASVFLVKNILHDWADSYAKIILTRLREAATADTRLLIVESLIQYACKVPQLDADDPTQIPGARPCQAPEPLLANFGDINIMQYISDVGRDRPDRLWTMIQMLLLYNSQERTIGHFVDLLGESGWNIQRVYRPSGSFLQQIEAVPI